MMLEAPPRDGDVLYVALKSFDTETKAAHAAGILAPPSSGRVTRAYEAAKKVDMASGSLRGFTVDETLVYCRDHVLGLRASAKADHSVKVAAETVKIVKATEASEALLGHSPPGPTGVQAATP